MAMTEQTWLIDKSALARLAHSRRADLTDENTLALNAFPMITASVEIKSSRSWDFGNTQRQRGQRFGGIFVRLLGCRVEADDSPQP
jgi:hypothetical protein